jgi:hypothetical protein
MTAVDITTELETYKKQGCNLLMPSTHIAGLSEFHQPIIETVTLSTNPDDGDVYPHDFSAAGPNKKWRPTKQALMKLSVCAGVIWSPTETRRVDNGSDRNYIAYKAVGGIKKADGQPVFFSAEYDMDFEVLEEEIREGHVKKISAWKDKPSNIPEKVDELTKRDILQKRKHKLKLCEAGAMNRVLRMLLGLKQAYTTTELQKPFVMARIVFRPDYSDAAVRKQFIDASIKAMTGIYGPQALDQEIRQSKPIDITALPPETDDDPAPEPETNQANCETKQPAGETKPETQQDSMLIDFMNSDDLGQCKTLTDISLTKGYDLAGFQHRAGAKFLGDIQRDKRVGLFNHIRSLPDKNKPVDDIPY